MVECTALEMRRAGNGTEGSNPSLSAIILRDIWNYQPADAALGGVLCGACNNRGGATG